MKIASPIRHNETNFEIEGKENLLNHRTIKFTPNHDSELEETPICYTNTLNFEFSPMEKLTIKHHEHTYMLKESKIIFFHIR